MSELSRIKVLRILNVVSLIVIVILLFHFRERFAAMIHPSAKELIENPAQELHEGTWINSQPLKMSKLRGKVIVLDFWTFQCINCQHILPTLNKWSSKYQDRDIVFIGVHTPETKGEEDLLSLQKFARENHIDYPIVTDNSYSTWNRYKVQFWPSTYLIDKKGVIR